MSIAAMTKTYSGGSMPQEFRFNPQVELHPHQQASLAAMCATDGYPVLHILLRSIVDQYMIDLQNVEVQDETEVLAKHVVSKTAAQIYTSITNRINEEIISYKANMPDNGEPSDPTEALLDIGPLASKFRDLEVQAFEEGLIDGE